LSEEKKIFVRAPAAATAVMMCRRASSRSACENLVRLNAI
jgi:hypothetical protein